MPVLQRQTAETYITNPRIQWYKSIRYLWEQTDYDRSYSWSIFGPKTYEYIDYITGPKSSLLNIEGVQVLVPNFKPVTHIKRNRVLEAGFPSVINWSTSTMLGKVTNPDFFPNYGGYAFDDHLVPQAIYPCGYLPSSYSDVIGASAVDQIKLLMLEDGALLGFPSAFNVLAFIGELRDVRKLPDLIRRWHKSDKDISDKFLGINFGVLPLFGDIIAIKDRVTKTGPAIDKWNDAASKGKVFNVHRSLPVPSLGPRMVRLDSDPKNPVPTFEGVFEKFFDDSKPGVTFGWSGKWVCKQQVTAKAHLYFHPLAVAGDDISSIKRHIWGVDKPLTAVWQLIPFSFVVDWFTNIGKLIETFEQRKPTLNMQILNAGYSVKVVTTITCTFTGGASYTYKDTYYKRVPITPQSLLNGMPAMGPLKFQPLSDNQTILGSALLHQLLR